MTLPAGKLFQKSKTPIWWVGKLAWEMEILVDCEKILLMMIDPCVRNILNC
jgi:hypothetical protein